MSRVRRLQRLEQHRPKIIYPGFSDMYQLQSKGAYNAWLIKHNPGLTQSDINELSVKHFEDCYE